LTEERVGIIAETFWNKLRITNLPDASEIRYLIRTVAAEARIKGIEEAMGRAKSACYDSSMGLDNMCWMEKRLDREAKRLKEEV